MTTNVHKFEAANLGTAPFKVVGFDVMKYQAAPGAPIQPGTSCDYCGTGIMNVYTIEGADGRKFKVGSDCVAKTGDAGMQKAVRQLVRTEKQKKAAAERAAAQVAVVDLTAKFLEAHPGLAEALTVDHAISRDLAAKLAHRGLLSVAQIALAFKLAAPKPVVPNLVAGRRELIGTIISTKVANSQWGQTLKMLVKLDDGTRVFGSVPVSLDVVAYGTRIKFTATVEVSKDELTFGFFSRPTKVQVV